MFLRVQADLDGGKKVLFIGLPCDSYALQLYLNKKYDNLYVCALICHGPTSPLVHKQFVQQLIDKHKCEVDEFSVRYKKEGWKPYYIRARLRNGYEHLEKFSESTYGIAFLYMKRPACNTCPIKRTKIHSDITIGDYHLAAGGLVEPENGAAQGAFAAAGLAHDPQGLSSFDREADIIDRVKLSAISNVEVFL